MKQHKFSKLLQPQIVLIFSKSKPSSFKSAYQFKQKAFTVFTYNRYLQLLDQDDCQDKLAVARSFNSSTNDQRAAKGAVNINTVLRN